MTRQFLFHWSLKNRLSDPISFQFSHFLLALSLSVAMPMDTYTYRTHRITIKLDSFIEYCFMYKSSSMSFFAFVLAILCFWNSNLEVVKSSKCRSLWWLQIVFKNYATCVDIWSAREEEWFSVRISLFKRFRSNDSLMQASNLSTLIHTSIDFDFISNEILTYFISTFLRKKTCIILVDKLVTAISGLTMYIIRNAHRKLWHTPVNRLFSSHN